MAGELRSSMQGGLSIADRIKQFEQVTGQTQGVTRAVKSQWGSVKPLMAGEGNQGRVSLQAEKISSEGVGGGEATESSEKSALAEHGIVPSARGEMNGGRVSSLGDSQILKMEESSESESSSGADPLSREESFIYEAMQSAVNGAFAEAEAERPQEPEAGDDLDAPARHGSASASSESSSNDVVDLGPDDAPVARKTGTNRKLERSLDRRCALDPSKMTSRKLVDFAKDLHKLGKALEKRKEEGKLPPDLAQKFQDIASRTEEQLRTRPSTGSQVGTTHLAKKLQDDIDDVTLGKVEGTHKPTVQAMSGEEYAPIMDSLLIMGFVTTARTNLEKKLGDDLPTAQLFSAGEEPVISEEGGEAALEARLLEFADFVMDSDKVTRFAGSVPDGEELKDSPLSADFTAASTLKTQVDELKGSGVNVGQKGLNLEGAARSPAPYANFYAKSLEAFAMASSRLGPRTLEVTQGLLGKIEAYQAGGPLPKLSRAELYLLTRCGEKGLRDVAPGYGRALSGLDHDGARLMEGLGKIVESGFHDTYVREFYSTYQPGDIMLYDGRRTDRFRGKSTEMFHNIQFAAQGGARSSHVGLFGKAGTENALPQYNDSYDDHAVGLAPLSPENAYIADGYRINAWSLLTDEAQEALGDFSPEDVQQLYHECAQEVNENKDDAYWTSPKGNDKTGAATNDFNRRVLSVVPRLNANVGNRSHADMAKSKQKVICSEHAMRCQIGALVLLNQRLEEKTGGSANINMPLPRNTNMSGWHPGKMQKLMQRMMDRGQLSRVKPGGQ